MRRSAPLAKREARLAAGDDAYISVIVVFAPFDDGGRNFAIGISDDWSLTTDDYFAGCNTSFCTRQFRISAV